MKRVALFLVVLSANANYEGVARSNSEPKKEKVKYIMVNLVEVRRGAPKATEAQHKEKVLKKTLKDCIKPNNVIDDEVVNCMGGK